MVNRIVKQGKKLFTSPQGSILSAASVIMIMIVASRVLGLVRQRTLAHFFAPDELSLFFAAFRLPDLVFEVLVFGTFSAAFIPVFTRSINKNKSEAWKTAATIVNIGLIVFLVFSLLLGLAAERIYGLFTPGFSVSDRKIIADLARLLFAAQGFFVVSYVLTGVLESLRRFLVPALAPLFYNVGIIAGTVFLSEELGLFAPVMGVIIGASLHFMIQLPLAVNLGFRFRSSIKITKEVKKIGKLALPRIIEMAFLQITKVAELMFASLISTASYTYFTFANTLQLLPVGIFGTSIAKAALPSLARQSKSRTKFRRTLFDSLFEMIFLVLPIATILIVLRVPVVRLAFGTDIFDWRATIQTGYVLSAFAVGVVFQSATALLARSFYALHDTKTPVRLSICAIVITVTLDYIFVRVLGLGVWSLAAAFSIGSFIQSSALLYMISKRLGSIKIRNFTPILKSVLSAFGSGALMFLLLKIFDRAAWVKRLSFVGVLENVEAIPFERFVLDTRFTINLLILTVLVSVAGLSAYIVFSILLRSKEVWTFFALVSRLISKKKMARIPAKEQEPISPQPNEPGG